MPDLTENQAVAPDADEEVSGSLASALLSAGFGTDGVLTEPELDPASDLGVAAEPLDDTAGADESSDVEEAAPDDADTVEEASAPDAADADAADAEDEQEVPEEPAPDAADADAADAEDEHEELEEPDPVSPYDLPGGWYVIHSYSGYENKVKANLATRTSSMHMEDRIFEVVIPMETVVEIKGGRKVEVEKKMFPGYILVRMYLDDDSWYAVRNTPGVTAFVGGGSKPTPLSRREVERFLGVKKEEEKKAPRFKPAWEVGETVRVVDGPFADFNGVIEDFNVDQQKVKVLVEIFGRDTPMELNFEQIQKQ